MEFDWVLFPLFPHPLKLEMVLFLCVVLGAVVVARFSSCSGDESVHAVHFY